MSVLTKGQITITNMFDGAKTAVVFLYTRDDWTPSLPTETIWYTFATGEMTNLTNRWSVDIPENDRKALWRIQTVVSSVNATVSIPKASWSRPAQMAKNGQPGLNGLDGKSVRLLGELASVNEFPENRVLVDEPIEWLLADGAPLYTNYEEYLSGRFKLELTGANYTDRYGNILPGKPTFDLRVYGSIFELLPLHEEGIIYFDLDFGNWERLENLTVIHEETSPYRLLRFENVKLSKIGSEEGDSYHVNGHLWTFNGTEWQDMGKISGKDGKDGVDGQSIISSTPEYYLSTSKTDQIGGSWTTTMPVWQKNRYLWMRLKNNFMNPTETKYTTPILDVPNEALNQIYDSGVVLPANKPSLYVRMVEIIDEHETYSSSSAAKASTKWNAYNTAALQLITYLSGITSNMSATTEINLDVFNQNFGDYSDSLEALRDDLETTYRNTLREVVEALWEAEVKITPEAITSVVAQSNLFADKSLESKISALEVNLAGFDATVTQSKVDGLGNAINELTSFFRFDANLGNPVIGPFTELGTSADQLKLRQYRNRISFMEGEYTKGYIEGESIHIRETYTSKVMFPHFEFVNEEGADFLESFYIV